VAKELEDMRFGKIALVTVLLAGASFAAQAATYQVQSGLTSSVFGAGALESIGLAFVGTTGAVPGALGPNSIGYGINSRNAVDPYLPTTFDYTTGTLAPFSGSIEHGGAIFLTDAATQTASVTIGNFTIGFDATRVGTASPDASGFFVKDNIDTGLILFDVTNELAEALEGSVVLVGDIVVSPELSAFLNDAGLVGTDVTGVDVGLGMTVGNSSIIPVPAAAWLFGSALGLLLWVRRRA
jgi:hypothetical protein